VTSEPDSSFEMSASRSRDPHARTELDMTSSLDETFARIQRTLKHASKFRRVKLTVSIFFSPRDRESVGVFDFGSKLLSFLSLYNISLKCIVFRCNDFIVAFLCVLTTQFTHSVHMSC